MNAQDSGTDLSRHVRWMFESEAEYTELRRLLAVNADTSQVQAFTMYVDEAHQDASLHTRETT